MRVWPAVVALAAPCLPNRTCPKHGRPAAKHGPQATRFAFMHRDPGLTVQSYEQPGRIDSTGYDQRAADVRPGANGSTTLGNHGAHHQREHHGRAQKSSQSTQLRDERLARSCSMPVKLCPDWSFGTVFRPDFTDLSRMLCGPDCSSLSRALVPVGAGKLRHPYAAWEYSRIRPPRRSLRRTRKLRSRQAGAGRPDGGHCCNVRCGR